MHVVIVGFSFQGSGFEGFAEHVMAQIRVSEVHLLETAGHPGHPGFPYSAIKLAT